MSGPRHFTMGAENMASVDCYPVLDVQNGRQDQGKQSNWEREWWMLCQLEYLNDSSIVSNSSGISPHDLTDVLFYAHSDSEVSC
jgi:hypothetical protein